MSEGTIILCRKAGCAQAADGVISGDGGDWFMCRKHMVEVVTEHGYEITSWFIEERK